MAPQGFDVAFVIFYTCLTSKVALHGAPKVLIFNLNYSYRGFIWKF